MCLVASLRIGGLADGSVLRVWGLRVCLTELAWGSLLLLRAMLTMLTLHADLRQHPMI